MFRQTHWYLDRRTIGTVYMVIGAVLCVYVVYSLAWWVLCGVAGYYCLSRGFTMYGYPPLSWYLRMFGKMFFLF